MSEDWMKTMAPGPMNEMLSHKVGEWNAEVKMWMDPSQLQTYSEEKQSANQFSVEDISDQLIQKKRNPKWRKLWKVT